ncbi:hypothetical protein [Devosia nitrariae]|uniref:Uncharacterized protein n=1 Tax=Devosia nitrariae TaxID=2071872 RepID=A0ABQ5W1M8_9HYPH|nr:hypothetical protein [Devosia nitrariae]GLQ53633.1 hypothetical protein GCM10010862_08920 [Devosia nitrariae]
MLSHTLPLRDRTGRSFEPTDEEAVELSKVGFRFSIFRPGREACHLSIPYETVIDTARGTITVRQPEEGEALTVRVLDSQEG